MFKSIEELRSYCKENEIVMIDFKMVDIDGICGGYNLQWAWSSGAVAGIHVARELS